MDLSALLKLWSQKSWVSKLWFCYCLFKNSGVSTLSSKSVYTTQVKRRNDINNIVSNIYLLNMLLYVRIALLAKDNSKS